MKKKITIIIVGCFMGAGVSIMASNPILSLVLDILFCLFLFWLISRTRRGELRLGGYIFAILICILFTLGPYFLIQTLGSSVYLDIDALVFGALITIVVYKDKKMTTTPTGAILAGVFIISTVWFSGQVMLLNVALDNSESVQYEGKITNMEIYQTLWPTYYLYIDFEDKSAEKVFTSSIQISRRQYLRYRQGETINVPVYDGFFGINYYLIT